MKTLILFALVLLSPIGFAKQFEIFDGQTYNGRFYTLVDIIEWGEQEGKTPHIEFHIHKRLKNRAVQDRAIELAVVAGEKGNTPVLWIMYKLQSPEERICRHVLAPKHFKEGMKLYSYKDSSDPDYENIYISSEPLKEKKLTEYKLLNYQKCDDEEASNKPDAEASAPVVDSNKAKAPSNNTESAKSDSGKTQEVKKTSEPDDGVTPFNF